LPDLSLPFCYFCGLQGAHAPGQAATAAEAVKQSVAAYPARLRLEFRDSTLSLNKKLPLEVKLPAWYMYSAR
jgi:hypothetical protein